jgi:hypothetical protein
MLYFCPTGFQIPYNLKKKYINITEQKMAIPKISQHNIFSSYSHPSLSLSFLSSSTALSSILSPFRLCSVFLAAPFPPSHSFPGIRSTCALWSHSPRVLYLLVFVAVIK